MKNKHSVFEILLYPIKFIFPLIFLIIFYMGISRSIKNIFKLYSFERGIVIDINTENSPIGGAFKNVIDFDVKGIMDSKKIIISTGLKYGILIGDTLDYKDFHDGNAIAFKKNGIQFTEPWSGSDIYLPILSIIIGWFYYKFYVKPFYLKYIKKKYEN